MNRAIDARSDLYALGVILYEQLAGALPFQQQDPLELIHAHMTALPAPLPAQVPADLAALVLRLLAKNPEDRPQDARELLTMLEDDSGLIRPTQSFRLPQKLYGRDTASATLMAGFRRAAAGACVFALVSGYAGIGKSSLVQELHRPLTASRGFFAAGKFDQYNRGVPFAAVIAAAATLLQHVLTLGPREISSWQARIGQAVGTALPVLAEIVPDVQAIVGPQPPALPAPHHRGPAAPPAHPAALHRRLHGRGPPAGPLPRRPPVGRRRHHAPHRRPRRRPRHPPPPPPRRLP
jgi:hypothetical protein